MPQSMRSIHICLEPRKIEHLWTETMDGSLKDVIIVICNCILCNRLFLWWFEVKYSPNLLMILDFIMTTALDFGPMILLIMVPMTFPEY
jgi:hypothetical protein